MDSARVEGPGRRHVGSLALLRTFAVLVAAQCFTASSAPAALVLEIMDASITAGGTGFVDVFIQSDGEDNLIDMAAYGFEIVDVTGTSGLEFVEPSDPPFEESAPNYLFFGNSLGVIKGPIGIDPTEYSGDDFSADGNGVLLPNGESRLLVRMDIRQVLSPGQNPATFPTAVAEIRVIESLTLFESLDEVPLNFDLAGSTIGQVTVTAVPEPSGLAFALGAGVAGIGLRQRRRRCAA